MIGDDTFAGTVTALLVWTGEFMVFGGSDWSLGTRESNFAFRFCLPAGSAVSPKDRVFWRNVYAETPHISARRQPASF